MGFWDRFRGIDSTDPAQRVLPAPYEPFVSTGGFPVMDPGTPLHHWLGSTADADHMWRTQPSVRKVIGFAARNVASIPLHVHERLDDNERSRVTDHPLARLMSSPRPRTGSYRFWEAVISDGLLHDRWAVLKRIADDGSMRLSRVPSWRLRFTENAFGEVEGAWFWNGDEWVELDLDELIFDYGYAPKSAGLSPVETLRDLLDESAEAVEYRRQVWANGARVPQWVKRPKDSGAWTPEQRDRFVAGMREYTKEGAKAGGIPVLEDDMSLENGSRMPSSEMQDLEGRKLSDVIVSSAWHIAPELIGAREGNYSNVDAYRQNLYRDSLGPYIVAWEQAINVGLTPDLADGRPLYVEANVEAKLRGSFLEQAEVLSKATGRPWMVTDEARARLNMPPIEGGDQLVTPLNVLVGGQASPRDGVTAGRGGGSIEAAPASEPEAATVGGFTPDEIVQLISAAATLIRSGFAPEASLIAVGLDPVEHLGLLPVTVQKPQTVDNPDEEIEEALKSAAAVRRSASSRQAVGTRVKSRAPETYEAKHREVLSAFFERQGKAVRSRLGAKDAAWWDGERWDGELGNDLLSLALTTAEATGLAALSAAGRDDLGYDVDRTVEFLKVATSKNAKRINDTTHDQVAEAIASGDPDAVAHVFDISKDSRAAQIATTAVTFASAFGAAEAAQQNSEGATKTWRVTSGNPRSSHAAMDGETVPLSEDFSNGLPWPGGIGDVSEVAGCMCELDINFP